MNARLQEPAYDQEEPSMPPLARIEEIVRDCLATCSRAPHPKAPDAASNLRHHMQAIERDLYEVRDLLAAIRALSASPLTEEQPTYRHKKRGTEYVLIGYGKMQSAWWSDAQANFASSVDMREVAVYRSATDPTEIWVRPREEFEDGRFEPLPRSTTGGAK